MDYLLIPVALFLALGNGANDNFMGFATVKDSETPSHRSACPLLRNLRNRSMKRKAFLTPEQFTQGF